MAREGRQVGRSWERPPPGTMAGRGTGGADPRCAGRRGTPAGPFRGHAHLWRAVCGREKGRAPCLGREALMRSGGRGAASQAWCRAAGSAARATVCRGGAEATAAFAAADTGDRGGGPRHAGRGGARHTVGMESGRGRRGHCGTVGGRGWPCGARWRARARGGRGVVQEVRRSASVAAGRGSYRSLAPLPRWTWPWRRGASLSEPWRQRAAGSRRPKRETVVQETRWGKGGRTRGGAGPPPR